MGIDVSQVDEVDWKGMIARWRALRSWMTQWGTGGRMDESWKGMIGCEEPQVRIEFRLLLQLRTRGIGLYLHQQLSPTLHWAVVQRLTLWELAA